MCGYDTLFTTLIQYGFVMEHKFYRRYVGSYMIAYVTILLILVGVSFLPLFEEGLPTSFSFIISFVSAFWPAHLFVKDHKRTPDSGETKRFAIGALVSVSILSAILMTASWNFAYSLEERDSITAQLMHTPFWLFAFAFIILVGVYYLAVRWAFGYAAKLELKGIEKAKEKGA